MLPLLAVGMLAIIAVVGLSIDAGHLFLNKTRLQNSLDSAALSGARTLMLSSNITAASTDARAVFDDHLRGDMADLDQSNLVLQFSNTLVPFVAGGSNPRFVRAMVENFATKLSFSSVLPDVDDAVSIAGSAVAGPIPVGYSAGGKTCDIAPILVCGVPGDNNCLDGSCFGIQIGANIERELRLRPETDNDTSGLSQQSASAGEFLSSQQSACGTESIYYDCIPAPDDFGGPGNFMLNYLGCAENTCIRENLAGSFDACLTPNATAAIEQDTSIRPILQGLMTRFGVYHNSLGAAHYPADVVVTSRTDNVDYWYENYKQDVSSVITTGSNNNAGSPYRRVVAVPVVNCQQSAINQSDNSILGILCFFLTRSVEASQTDEYLYGQFVSECEASGEQGESVPGMSNTYPGPLEIILYKDPDTYDS